MIAPVELAEAAQRIGMHPAAAFTALTRMKARGERRGRRWYFEQADVAQLEALAAKNAKPAALAVTV